MFFIVYTIAQLFVKIPTVFNNILYGIITAFAIYFAAFYTEVGKGIKDKFSENYKKSQEEKSK